MKSELDQQIMSKIIDGTRKAALREWRELVAESDEPIFDYRGDHVLLVTSLARLLARAAGADERVVTLAALLHDSAKPGLGGADDHEILSAQIAEKILLEAGVDRELIGRVCEAIRKHAGLTLDEPLVPIEAQVLWEADKLAKLGVTGMLHHLINGLRLRPGLNMRQLAKSISDFLPLASKITASMHTEMAQRIALERMRHLRELSMALDLELRQGGMD